MSIHFLSKTRSVLLTIFTLLLMLLTATYVYSTWLERPYLSYDNLPFPALSKAEPGKRLAIQVGRCSSSNVTETYKTTHGIRNEVTGQSIVLPSVSVAIKPGCMLEISKINVVPEEAKPGFYSFYGVSQVRGLMTMHEVPWNSETFEVLAKTKEPINEIRVEVENEISQ